ncbi:protein of unknown function (plasmid) [Caballeronia sp. S22]
MIYRQAIKSTRKSTGTAPGALVQHPVNTFNNYRAAMSKPAYFEVSPLLRKVEPPYYPREVMCPGRPWDVSTHMVVVAPRDHP